MQTNRSAKRVILFLIGLNIVTILTSVTLLSSGMFVASAAPPKPCPPSSSGSGSGSGSGTSAGTDQTDLVNLFFDKAQHDGILQSDKHKKVATMTMKFDGTPQHIKDVAFTSQDTTGKGNFSWASTGPAKPHQSTTKFVIKVNPTDTTSANGVISFDGANYNSSNKRLEGTWTMNQSFGFWTLNA